MLASRDITHRFASKICLETFFCFHFLILCFHSLRLFAQRIFFLVVWNPRSAFGGGKLLCVGYVSCVLGCQGKRTKNKSSAALSRVRVDLHCANNQRRPFLSRKINLLGRHLHEIVGMNEKFTNSKERPIETWNWVSCHARLWTLANCRSS